MKKKSELEEDGEGLGTTTSAIPSDTPMINKKGADEYKKANFKSYYKEKGSEGKNSKAKEGGSKGS